MITKTITLSDKQSEFLHSTDKNLLFQAGIGSGKTFTACIWVIKEALENEDSVILIVGLDYPQIRNSILPELLKVMTEVFDFVEDEDFTHNKANNTIILTQNKSKLILLSSNKYESIRGINASHIWLDECDYHTPDSFRVLLGRLRIGPELLRCTSSPDGFNHIYDFFKDKTTIIASSYSSITLTDEYLNQLKATYSPKLYRQEVMAERLALKTGAVYTDFNRDIHVRDLGPNFVSRNDNVHFFTDYNVSYYCGCFIVFKNNTLYVVDEITLNNKTTHDMAQAVLAKQYYNLLLSGDSTGNNKRDVSTTQTNYDIFRSYKIDCVREHNPLVTKRIITVNSRLYSKNIVIDAKCKTLIRDLELVSYKKNSSDIDKTSDPSLTHMSDSFGYAVNRYLSLKTKRARPTVIDI